MFKLAIEVRCKTYFNLIHVIFLSLGSTKPVYFFGTPGSCLAVSTFMLHFMHEVLLLCRYTNKLP